MNVPAIQSHGQLSTIPVDPEIIPGARNAVDVCLRVKPTEKVTIITDEATKEIAAALLAEVEALGAAYRPWLLEDLAPRPLSILPPESLPDLVSSQVRIFA